MLQSDALSRRPDYGIDESTGKEEQTLLPENMFINLLDINLQEWILDSSDKTMLEMIMKDRPTNLQNDLANWKIEDIDRRKTIFYKGKNYIPNDQELQRDIIKMFHHHETARHPGELKTYNLVRQYYWWPGLQTFIKTYVQGCRICQQIPFTSRLSANRRSQNDLPVCQLFNGLDYQSTAYKWL